MGDTIPYLLRRAARVFGDKAALVPPSAAPLGFVALDRLADAFARALLSDGVPFGARVCVWAPNSPEWIAAAVGAQRAGAVLIPLYFQLRGAEVADVVRRAGARYVVCPAELAAQLRGEQLPSLRRVIVQQPGSSASGLREISWNALLAAGADISEEALHERERQVTGATVSDIMFTSGTTGRPKGAVFTHASGVAAARIMQDYNGATEADCICPMGSFAHVGGYKQGWVTALATGAAITWGDAFDAVSVLQLVSRLRITIMPAAPITWQGILDYQGRDSFDISCLRFVATGGTMIPAELVRRLRSELDVRQIGTGYGMTETCGMDAYTRPDDPPDKVAGTVGRAAPDTELRIVDAAGNDVTLGDVGEILIRNPRCLIEYLDDAEATAGALDHEGWYHSGDVGRLDADGYLTITDRLKDMYIINGLNVYPAEIERELGMIEGVGQCAVIGVPEPVKGEVGCAFIVRTPGKALDEEDVRAWCREKLAGYKVPRYVTFVDDLPRNAMGKVLKNALRQVHTVS